jgi:hypothetical protein
VAAAALSLRALMLAELRAESSELRPLLSCATMASAALWKAGTAESLKAQEKASRAAALSSEAA